MKLTEEIRKAIEMAAAEAGSQNELGQKTKIASSLINKYINGRVKSINLRTWKVLYPHLKKYFRDPADCLQPGDTVKLKSGSPLMTVVESVSGGVRCVWFLGKETRDGIFPEIALYREAPGWIAPEKVGE